jgi:hypothetical protein
MGPAQTIAEKIKELRDDQVANEGRQKRLRRQFRNARTLADDDRHLCDQRDRAIGALFWAAASTTSRWQGRAAKKPSDCARAHLDAVLAHDPCRRDDRMKRRDVITLLGGAAARPLAARGQQTDRMRRVGVLMYLSESDSEVKGWITAFQEGLQQLGWTQGRNIRIEYRWGGGDHHPRAVPASGR